ncbi:unnamed protein product [Rotaria socialis]|uniref:Mab-21-like HhH/H2TH-like domain-containing protein n=2 Tax=Rotaria socialis TaxID=392032 RepID=A0A819XH78_9BILA|nr:unnamed protein product [Rotaria socialis]CAF3249559.1 unnamed protein product [Rotaria socialis]CAF3338414.1 unnamed protein product [Rotaria socialis]CAF3742070.1 unnamed protein product [Rotaria socialis]CAF4135787.1 unnamed protein product [Rotaria socialis]
MKATRSPPKTSAHREVSSERSHSSYDALRFLRTTNKWDKDFLPPICPSRFSNHNDFESSLQEFYYEVVDIMPDYVDHVRKACRVIFDDVVPRLRKNRFGIVLNDPIFCDTFFENLQVVHIQRINILIPITIRPVEKERLEKIGYIYLRIPGAVNDEELSRYDPWGFMRSRKDRQYLSPGVLVQLVHSLVDDALREPYPLQHFTLEPLDLDHEGSVIRIRHEELMFTICLSFGVKIKKTDPYFITKPFTLDDYFQSKRAWRVSYIEAEMKCLKVLHRADHFRHAQAIKIFLALVKLNRIFSVLNEDIIKALMVYICDDDLTNRNWNRRRCNEIFWSLFDLLYVSIDQQVLKHPYLPEMNLLEKIERPKLIRLKKHLDYIVEHKHEFERFFNRRVLSCKRRRNQSKNLFAFFGSSRNELPKDDDDDDDDNNNQNSGTSGDQENYLAVENIQAVKNQDS